MEYKQLKCKVHVCILHASAADALAAVFFPFRAAASVAGASEAEAFLFGAMAVVAKENSKSLGTRAMEQERKEEDGTGAARRANA